MLTQLRTVLHPIREFPKIAQADYSAKHNWVASQNPGEHRAQKMSVNDQVKIFWDFQI